MRHRIASESGRHSGTDDHGKGMEMNLEDWVIRTKYNSNRLMHVCVAPNSSDKKPYHVFSTLEQEDWEVKSEVYCSNCRAHPPQEIIDMALLVGAHVV